MSTPADTKAQDSKVQDAKAQNIPAFLLILAAPNADITNSKTLSEYFTNKLGNGQIRSAANQELTADMMMKEMNTMFEFGDPKEPLVVCYAGDANDAAGLLLGGSELIHPAMVIRAWSKSPVCQKGGSLLLLLFCPWASLWVDAAEMSQAKNLWVQAGGLLSGGLLSNRFDQLWVDFAQGRQKIPPHKIQECTSYVSGKKLDHPIGIDQVQNTPLQKLFTRVDLQSPDEKLLDDDRKDPVWLKSVPFAEGAYKIAFMSEATAFGLKEEGSFDPFGAHFVTAAPRLGDKKADEKAYNIVNLEIQPSFPKALPVYIVPVCKGQSSQPVPWKRRNRSDLKHLGFHMWCELGYLQPVENKGKGEMVIVPIGHPRHFEAYIAEWKPIETVDRSSDMFFPARRYVRVGWRPIGDPHGESVGILQFDRYEKPKEPKTITEVVMTPCLNMGCTKDVCHCGKLRTPIKVTHVPNPKANEQTNEKPVVSILVGANPHQQWIMFVPVRPTMPYLPITLQVANKAPEVVKENEPAGIDKKDPLEPLRKHLQAGYALTRIAVHYIDHRVGPGGITGVDAIYEDRSDHLWVQSFGSRGQSETIGMTINIKSEFIQQVTLHTESVSIQTRNITTKAQSKLLNAGVSLEAISFHKSKIKTGGAGVDDYPDAKCHEMLDHCVVGFTCDKYDNPTSIVPVYLPIHQYNWLRMPLRLNECTMGKSEPFWCDYCADFKALNGVRLQCHSEACALKTEDGKLITRYDAETKKARPQVNNDTCEMCVNKPLSYHNKEGQDHQMVLYPPNAIYPSRAHHKVEVERILGWTAIKQVKSIKKSIDGSSILVAFSDAVAAFAKLMKNSPSGAASALFAFSETLSRFPPS